MSGQGTDMKRGTYTVVEAARVLGISREVAYRAVSTGEIPSVRIGKRILIPRVALDRLLAADTPTRPVEAA